MARKQHGKFTPQDPPKSLRIDPKISVVPNSSMIKPPSSGIEPDTSDWMTRNECADLLRRSVTTIANYERLGKLKPHYVYRHDSRGIEHRVAVYDPKELQKLRNPELKPAVTRDRGEIAARSFELFGANKSLRDVVIELRIPPEQANELHMQWQEAGDTELTITSAARLVLEKYLGAFADIDTLLTLIVERFKTPEQVEQVDNTAADGTHMDQPSPGRAEE